MTWGGSHIRPEATGYGLVYYVEHMLRDLDNTTFSGKRVLISGSGNVAQYAALKVIELGGTVLSLSDSTGSLIATTEEGFHPSDVEAIATVKLNRQPLTAFVESDKSAKSRFKWHDGKRPWTLVDKVDVALPSATQNEVSKEEAEALIKAGARYIAEGSNMGCTQEAIEVFEATREKATSLQAQGICWYAPGKAANCGGVAVSGLEMSQNSAREQWDFETLDNKLKAIMENCFNLCSSTGREYSVNGQMLPSLVVGGNVAGFVKVAEAARAQGQWW
jgi:glutamate dehydrogenase (NADP+)